MWSGPVCIYDARGVGGSKVIWLDNSKSLRLKWEKRVDWGWGKLMNPSYGNF